jgi:hypothetical protein
MECEATQQQGELADERAAVMVRLADLHQRESALKAGQAMMIDHAERELPTFIRASQNVAAVATLLDTLPAPSTDGVGEVYQRLENTVETAVVYQVKSSLQHQDEASILTPTCPMNGGQRVAQGALEVGTTSSLVRISTYDRLS